MLRDKIGRLKTHMDDKWTEFKTEIIATITPELKTYMDEKWLDLKAARRHCNHYPGTLPRTE
jgi:hypothetical protein